MPWTLNYPEDIDGRIFRNAHRALFTASPYVARTEIRNHPCRLVVHFRNDNEVPADGELYRIFQQYRVAEPAPYTFHDISFVREGGHPIQSPTRDTPLDLDAIRDLQSRLVQQALESTEGRTRLALSMAAPLRQRLDYSSIGRRTLLVEQLPQGALPTYGADLNVTQGFDANGSPVSDPPVLAASWMVVDQWVYRARDLEHGQIRAIQNGISVSIWRTERTEWISIPDFARDWTPCEKPAEPKPFWDRLQEDFL